ncbi:MAG: endo-1,4-beta-xylanase [Phycisphaerae bacterium]
MLSFAVFFDGQPADELDLSSAYVLGTDDVPLRAELGLKNGVIGCRKRAAGPAGLALVWKVSGIGEVLLESVRVPERRGPYLLTVELARGRLMRLSERVEDWGLLAHASAADGLASMDTARDLLIRALQADGGGEASALGDASLMHAVRASETLAGVHAEQLLAKRCERGGVGRRAFGCAVGLGKPTDLHHKRLSTGFDFATLPMTWRDIEPREQAFHWEPLDTWVEWLAKHHIPIRGTSLVSFSEANVPDWLYIWEHDFDTIRDLAFEHARRVLTRYGQYVQVWDVISGIHAPTCFAFTFEQLMELTRMAAALCRQASPRSGVVIDMVMPWGEYYARNQRTIPPALYADMVVQSGVNFDAFGLQFRFGRNEDGMFARDMFSISALLDQFGKVGKPLHITGVQVPSAPAGDDDGGTQSAGGVWHEPWSESVQAAWLRQFLEIAMSKPFVERVSWGCLADAPKHGAPHDGVLRADLTPKPAFEALVKLRAELSGKGGGSRGGSPA